MGLCFSVLWIDLSGEMETELTTHPHMISLQPKVASIFSLTPPFREMDSLLVSIVQECRTQKEVEVLVDDLITKFPDVLKVFKTRVGTLSSSPPPLPFFHLASKEKFYVMDNNVKRQLLFIDTN